MSLPEGAQGAKGKDDKGSGTGPTVENIVGAEIAVLTDLSNALQGVTALGAVIGLMEQAANSIVTSATDGKLFIDYHVLNIAKPEILRYVNEDMKREINKQAGEALKQAIQDNIANIVANVLAALLKGGYSA